MIRDHNLYKITISLRKVYTIGGDQDGGGQHLIEDGRSSADFTILARNQETAQAWIDHRIRYMSGKEHKVESIVDIGRLDAFIEEHTW